MKLKYYLRGLGIGILVTAVIMGITQESRKQTLSDREIRERAAALGMVEPGNSLADLQATEAPTATAKPTQKPVATETPAATETPTATAKPTEKPTEKPTAKPTEKPTAKPTEKPTEKPTQKPTEEEDTYVLEIQSGDGSYQVAYRLQQAGLVADARDFDNFLCSKGYDRKLRIGSYEIPKTATEEEISEILGGR